MINEERKPSKKKGIIIVSIVVLIIALVGGYLLKTQVFDKVLTPPEEKEEEKQKTTPLMYEITKEGSNNKIYLFGSIHFADISKFEFPDYIMDAYKDSKYLACEFDIVKTLENLDTDELLKDYYYTYPDSLKEHVSSESYDKILKFMKEKFKYDEAQVNIMSLTFIDSLITQLLISKSNINSQDGVDTYFLNKAHDENKIVLEVESYEFQANLEKEFPDRVNELAIIDAIDNFEDSINDLNNLYTSWKKGNEEELIKLLLETEEDADLSEEDKKLLLDYNKKMVDDRNIGMKNKLEEYFNNVYTVFYMVGAAHLVGDNGIAKLVEQDGYTVKIIK